MRAPGAISASEIDNKPIPRNFRNAKFAALLLIRFWLNYSFVYSSENTSS